MTESTEQVRLIHEAARRGAALVKMTREATGTASVEALVARAMSDLRAFSAIADADMAVVLSETIAMMEEMTGDD